MGFFPDPADDYEEGLVAVGGSLNVAALREAYSLGIFPWPQEGYPMLWFCPLKRGILHFKDFKISRSFKKDMKAFKSLKVLRDQNFEAVIRGCAAQKRKDQKGTWITEEMIRAYLRFFEAGYVRCWEVWEEDELVGGGYGVFCKGVFAGESLFHKKTGMSKLALVHMVEDLKSEGLTWMDTQMVTPLLASFGAIEIGKNEYLDLLKKSQRKN